jgi:tetraacyldisaccharide 4'-kinase
MIAGQAGAWALPILGTLRLAESLYASGVALRNYWYDRRGPRAQLPVPVISVGNVTVGGTGKTPLVIDLVRHLERMGLSPAVASRGYKAFDDQSNDEQSVIRAHCPGVVCVSDPDRIRAAELAHVRFGADVIVLDDGFQHRRLGRTLDIIVVDATCPFGYGHLLPRGLLREPIRSLGRANVVVITRSDQVSPAELSRLDQRLRKIAPVATHLRCTHRVQGVERLDGTPIDGTLEGKRAVLFAGIGQPQAFATTVRTLGVEVVGEHWWPDHYHYRGRDINSMLKPGRFPPHELMITTEKDAAKLTRLGGLDHVDILVLRIAIDFAGEGCTILQSVLEQTLPKG